MIRQAAFPLLTALALVLSGCVPTEHASRPELPPTSTRPPVASPTPTSEIPSATPPPPAEFTTGELIDLCVQDSTPYFSTAATFNADQARVEERAIDPKWLVYIPVSDATAAIEIAALCIYGGTPLDVEKLTYGGRAALTEEEIVALLNSNEMFETSG